MRSPLAALKLYGSDGSFFWRVAFSATVCRGMRPIVIVYMRIPTPEERETVEAGLFPGGQTFLLDELIQWKVLDAD